MTAVYGFSVVRTKFGGGEEVFDVSGCATPDEAVRKAYEWAYESGWKPPLWWQWWRWADTKEFSKQFPSGIKKAPDSAA